MPWNHFWLAAVLTALTAASSKSEATSILRFLFFSVNSFNMALALSALVPVSLQTRGSLRSTSCAALMMPVAIVSHFIIPPKMLIRTVFTLGWDDRISKAVFTCSTLAPPPTSRKLAGSPPFNLMISIVAMARPAPLTMHPMLPSSATQLSPAAMALSSRGSMSSEASEFFLRSNSSFCLNLALSSMLILASTAYISCFGLTAHGLISSCTASHLLKRLQRLRTCSLNPLTDCRLRSTSNLFNNASVMPVSTSMGQSLTAEGLCLATSSISTPPSTEATMAGRWVLRSRMKARQSCRLMSTPSWISTALTLSPSLGV